VTDDGKRRAGWPRVEDRRPGGHAVRREGVDQTVSETLLRIGETLVTSLGVSECCIYEVDEEAGCLRGQAVWSTHLLPETVEFMEGADRLTALPKVREALERRVATVIHRDEEPPAAAERESMEYWGEATALFVPLVSGERAVGLLELTQWEARREFRQEELQLVEAFARVAALAIENARSAGHQQRLNRRLAALLHASRALASTMVVDEVLQRLAKEAAETLRVPSCYIYEYDAAGDAIVWRTEYQADADRVFPDPPGTAYPLDDYPWDREVLRRGELRVWSVDDPGLSPEHRRSMEEWAELTMITVPLCYGGEPVGMMELAETRPGRRFSEDDLSLARALGEQAAVALRNAQLFRRETWRNERLVRLLSLSGELTGVLSPEAITATASAGLPGLFPEGDVAAQAVSLVSTEDEEADGSGDAASGGTPAAGAPPTVDKLVSEALAAGSPRQALDGRRRRLVVPLVHKREPVGWLDLRRGSGRPFEQDEVELLQILANQMAVALDNSRLYATLAHQATTDGLTGLLNHRAFYERLHDEVVRARRYDLPLSLLMLDLDDFKRYNDRYGHPAGDEVLRRVGRILSTELRRNIDLPARYGGEEFAVILPHTGCEGARAVGERLSQRVSEAGARHDAPAEAAVAAERVRRRIAGERFPNAEGRATAHLTVSVGVATLPAHALDAESLVQCADEALYRAKRQGKNRVEVYA